MGFAPQTSDGGLRSGSVHFYLSSIVVICRTSLALGIVLVVQNRHQVHGFVWKTPCVLN